MDEVTKDSDLQRRFGLKAFFESAGFAEFNEEVKSMLEGSDDSINNLQKAYVASDKASELNFLLGQKKAFQNILGVLDSLRAELEERE